MHLEVQIKKHRKYYYAVENIRAGTAKWKKLRVYLGKDLSRNEQKHLAKIKRKDLLKKVEKAKKESDPLLYLIPISELKILANIKVRYKKCIKETDKLQYENYYEKFVSEFTYDTNAIEGSTLTLNEISMILFDKIVPKGKSIREINEAQNHKDAFDFMLKHKDDINKRFVLQMHRLLMHNILWKYAGKFRDVQVYIRGVDLIPPPPQKIESEFKKLMFWYRRNKKKYHPVIVAAYMHHVFESIHPFRDGNGRIGRLLMNFILRKNGFPMINIKYKDRVDYYSALNHGNKGNLKPLADLIIKYLKESDTLI